MPQNYAYYLEVPHVGELFFEVNGVTYGRTYIDGSVHKWGAEIWAGACHLTVDVRGVFIKLISAIAVAAAVSSALSVPARMATMDDVSMEIILDPLDYVPDRSFT